MEIAILVGLLARVRELEQENESLQAECVEQIASTMAAIEQAKREGC